MRGECGKNQKFLQYINMLNSSAMLPYKYFWLIAYNIIAEGKYENVEFEDKFNKATNKQRNEVIEKTLILLKAKTKNNHELLLKESDFIQNLRFDTIKNFLLKNED